MKRAGWHQAHGRRRGLRLSFAAVPHHRGGLSQTSPSRAQTRSTARDCLAVHNFCAAAVQRERAVDEFYNELWNGVASEAHEPDNEYNPVLCRRPGSRRPQAQAQARARPSSAIRETAHFQRQQVGGGKRAQRALIRAATGGVVPVAVGAPSSAPTDVGTRASPARAHMRSQRGGCAAARSHSELGARGRGHCCR